MDKLHFRVWLEDKEDKKNKIRNLIDGQNLIFFFKKGDNIFGGPEESRLVFAKMKSPDEDMPDNWADEANFAAFDLFNALQGNQVMNMFGGKDLNDINVISPEEAEQKLMKSHDKEKPKTTKLTITHGKHGAGMLKLKDKK